MTPRDPQQNSTSYCRKTEDWFEQEAHSSDDGGESWKEGTHACLSFIDW
jgi:hypothetical protein